MDEPAQPPPISALPETALFDAPTGQLVDAVAAAARLARAIQRDAPQAIQKEDRTPVTVADLAVQAVVASALERAFPGDALVAEEDASLLEGETGRRVAEQAITGVRPLLPGLTRGELVRLVNTGGRSTGARFWTLDPLDGTKGYLRGGHYVVALALLEDSRPSVAVLGCPTLDSGNPDGRDPGAAGGLVLVARRGGGAWIRPLDGGPFRRIRTSTVRSGRDARMVQSLAEGHANAELMQRFIAAAGIAAAPLRMDSQAKYVLVAAGLADLFVRVPGRPDYRECIWDHAAGALAVEEAGGRVTDLAGRPFDFTAGRRLERNYGVVVSNGPLHRAVLDALGEAPPRA